MGCVLLFRICSIFALSGLVLLLLVLQSYFLELLSLVVEVVEFFAFKVEFFRLNFL